MMVLRITRRLGLCVCILTSSINAVACRRREHSTFIGFIRQCRHSSRRQVQCQHETIMEPEHILTAKQMNTLTELVQKRADSRWRGDFDEADEFRAELDTIDLPYGYFVSLHDVPRKLGGGSSWSLVRNTTEMVLEGTTVLQLAHAALGLALSWSERQVPLPPPQLQALIQQANSRLILGKSVEPELRGRKAADAAFWFSLAGAHDEVLFQSLSRICAKELGRFGTRTSCRGKDVWHILERLAAAGIRNDADLERVGKLALESKGETLSTGNIIDFHSDRCLLMIWKFSTKQRKQRAFLEAALKHWERQETQEIPENPQKHELKQYDWQEVYADPTRPLVIDVGCGMGVSLLGLAQQEIEESCYNGVLVENWSHCNFAGVDLSGLAIGFGQSISKRWGLDDRLHFFVDNAELFLRCVIQSYPGPVELCLVQFPTPYRLSKVLADNGELALGNSQLPSDTESGFMVNSKLLEVINQVLFKTNGKLLVQSNCEDVALWIKQTASDTIGFQAVDCSLFETESNKVPLIQTKRTLDWISMGGERAEGMAWSKGPILPRKGRTETEVACSLNGVPVHRCLLKSTT